MYVQSQSLPAFPRLNGVPMDRVNEFVFYDLAEKLRPLKDAVTDGYIYRDNWLRLWDARIAINNVHVGRSLHFSSPAAQRLYAAITNVIPEDFDDVMSTWEEKTGTDGTLTVVAYRVSEIKSAAKEFETAIRTECELMDTYFVSKKGAYSTKDLIEHAYHQIPEPARSELPDQAKTDFEQAGKCMAFDVTTASAFHLLRGTEAVIREYYNLIVPGNKQASTKMRNWGVYIKLMRDHGGNVAALSILDHMRDVYRNPVTHPEENYTDEKVQVLFGLCVSAVTLLMQAIRAAKLTSGSLAFPPKPMPPGLLAP